MTIRLDNIDNFKRRFLGMYKYMPGNPNVEKQYLMFHSLSRQDGKQSILEGKDVLLLFKRAMK